MKSIKRILDNITLNHLIAIIIVFNCLYGAYLCFKIMNKEPNIPSFTKEMKMAGLNDEEIARKLADQQFLFDKYVVPKFSRDQ